MKKCHIFAVMASGAVFLAGCYPSTLNLAPASYDRPWRSQNPAETSFTDGSNFTVVPDPSLPFVREMEVRIEQGHVYSLAELIDLAQRANPETRIAWERARQAAVAVGLHLAAYLPQITAEAIAGRQRQSIPVPVSPNHKGYYTLTANEVAPSLVVQWLLFDFGKREGEVESSRQISTAANIVFTGAHQKLIFDVSRAYFVLEAERAQLRVAEESLKNARTIQDAAEQKFARGLGTRTEVAIAHQKTAKAEFSLAHARTADNDAYHALLESMGLTPTLKLEIGGTAGRDINRLLGENTDIQIRKAISRRPDVAAALAKLRAVEAEEKSARAAFYPTVGLVGSYGQNFAPYGIDDEPTYYVREPESKIMIRLSMPLFDAGIRSNSLKLARSRKEEALSDLIRAQDRAVRQISHSYDTMKSTLSEYDATCALVAASSIAYSSAFESYRHGVGTLTNAVDAETNLEQAESARARSYSNVLTSAAALAFANGELTSSAVLKP